MTIRIVRPGLLTTVQDLGRPGLAALGVPGAGAMDAWSLRAANRLVGNRDGAAALELTLIGPEIAFHGDAWIALAGSAFEAAIDGRPIAHGTSLRVRAGQRLATGRSREGARGYLAFAGGIDVPPALGSRSTYLGGGFGGHAGRPLRAGDVLAIGPHPADVEPRRLRDRPHWRSHQTLRVVPGPQAERFTAAGLAEFFGAVYRVSQRSDRTGVRLEGPPIDAAVPRDVDPEGLAPGAIQVPADGLPILLGCERPTTGGYAKIATVVGADLPRLGQAKPGDRLAFAVVEVAAARRLWQEEEDRLRAAIEAA